jgi:hypothetical protein
MSFQTGRVWNEIQLDPRPESEPELTEVTTRVWRSRLFLPAAWDEERRQRWLEWWMKW